MGVMDERKSSGGRGCLVVGLLSLALSGVVAFIVSGNYAREVAACQSALHAALPDATLVEGGSPNFLQINGSVTTEYSITLSVEEINATLARAIGEQTRAAAQAGNVSEMGSMFGTYQVDAVEGGSHIVQLCP